MPHKINYKTYLTPEFNKFGLRRCLPSQAVLVSDNISSDFSLRKTVQEDDAVIPKRIFEVNNSGSQTHIVSNTTDLYMTDVFSEDGEPLYFKVQKRIKYFDKVYINGKEHTEYDHNFIYTSEESGEIKYVDDSGRNMLVERGEFHDCFIWENLVNLESIIETDGRTYSYNVNNDKIVVTCKKPSVFAIPKHGSIMDLFNLNKTTFGIKPFFHKTTKEIDGERVSFEYDYSVIVPNIRTVNDENSSMIDRSNIHLGNRSVLPESVSISVIDRITREEIYNLSNTDVTEIHNIRSKDGIVNIKPFIESNNLDPLDYIFISSYQYLEILGNRVVLDPENIDIKFKKVFFSIKPTKVIQEGFQTNIEPTLTYTITESDGSIVSSIDDEIPLYEYEIPVSLGFGEDGYSEHGWSGVTDETTIEVVSEGGDIYGTGYGDGSYSEGPFGGSYIANIEDIQNLLGAQSNSLSGQITIAEIDFTPSIKSAKIFKSIKMAKNNTGIPVKELDLFSGSVWHLSLNTSFTDLDFAAGIKEYRSTTGVFIPGAVINEDASFIYMRYDISKVSQFMDVTGAFDTAYVMTDTAALAALDLYTTFLPTASIDKDTLTLYNDSYEVIAGVEYILTEDLQDLMVKIPVIEKGSIVGLGIDNITPTGWTQT